MKTLQTIIHLLFTVSKQDCICEACSYYGDNIIDDNTAFVHPKDQDRGWIVNYVRKKFGK